MAIGTNDSHIDLVTALDDMAPEHFDDDRRRHDRLSLPHLGSSHDSHAMLEWLRCCGATWNLPRTTTGRQARAGQAAAATSAATLRAKADNRRRKCSTDGRSTRNPCGDHRRRSSQPTRCAWQSL